MSEEKRMIEQLKEQRSASPKKAKKAPSRDEGR